ncbi:MAG: autotransporter outer membrane beta-barrel domain-containing protein, partial [Planctomycetes bacterium]|nr:autotransporter outer membrane beta-barrel domain-containing protein [Planctomycetota bacterium]
TNMTISDNSITITGSTDVAAFGGGAFIDATNYDTDPTKNKAGGSVVFSDVYFTDNSVTVTGSGTDTSSTFGGGVRIKGAVSFTYTGGTVSDNSIETINGSHAAGGGISIDDYSIYARLNSVEITGNTATVTGSGISNTSRAMGGGLYAYHEGNGNGDDYTDEDSTYYEETDFLTLYISGGNISENRAVANGTGTEAWGGGVYVNGHVLGTISGVEIADNVASSDTGNAYGGGVVYTPFDFERTSDQEELYLTITGSTITGNVADASAATADSAFGGGIFNAGTMNITSSEVTGNYAKGSDNSYGGGIYSSEDGNLTITSSTIDGNVAQSGLIPDGYTGIDDGILSAGGGLYNAGEASISSSYITNNVAENGAENLGGGLFNEGTLSIENSNIQGNIVRGGTVEVTVTGDEDDDEEDVVTETTVHGGPADLAAGAGIYNSAGGEVTIDTANVTGNLVNNTEIGYGGGIYTEGKLEIASSSVSGNAVEAEDLAAGGGIYADGSFATVTVSDTTIASNTVTALDGEAYGGGAAFDGLGSGKVTITGSTIRANTATGDVARGGGIYASETDVSLTDTDVTGNQAVGADAAGGGIYMDTGSSSAELTLTTSEDGSMTISGNTTWSGDEDDDKAIDNGITFGGSGNGSLNLVSDGVIYLADSMVVDVDGNFTMVTAGDGIINWGGNNTFKTGAGSTTTIELGGSVYLTKDFQATFESEAQLEISATFGFDGLRDNETAMFDFSGVTGSSLKFLSDSELAIDLSSELLSGDFEYLLATGYNDSLDGKTTFTDDHYDTELVKIGSDVWIKTAYTSLYQNLIDNADPNTKSAIDADALTDLFREMSAEERAAFTESQSAFDNATPGWYMNMPLAGLDTLLAGVDAARTFGLGHNGYGSGLYVTGLASDLGVANLDPDLARCGTRLWAGYIGDSDRMDSHGGYYGYKATRHGFLIGFNYDNGEASSIGIYGGYSHTKTKARGITAEVKSDTGHFGVIGRLAPVRGLPQLGFSADASYTFSKNDGSRGRGILNSTSEFDQKYYTLGLEAEYVTRFGPGFFTPFASARYVRVQQDGFTEKGFLAGHLDDVKENIFQTKLGARFGYDHCGPTRMITPALTVAWRHDYGTNQYSSNAVYNVPEPIVPIVYKVRSAKADRNSVDVGASVRALLNTDTTTPMGVNLGYNLNASSNKRNHSVYVGFDLSF